MRVSCMVLVTSLATSCASPPPSTPAETVVTDLSAPEPEASGAQARPIHQFTLKPAVLAHEYRPKAVRVFPLQVDYEALPQPLARGVKDTLASLSAAADEPVRQRLQRELALAQGLPYGPAEQAAADKRLADLGSRAARKLRAQKIALGEAMARASGAQEVELLVALVALLRGEASLAGMMPPSLHLGMSESLAQVEPTMRSCQLSLYLAQQWQGPLCMDIPQFFEAATRYEPCGLMIPRFRGHPNRREDASGESDGEARDTKEETVIHPRVQG